MKVLVTGAGGFLGAAVVKAAAAAGHQVKGLYRPASLPDVGALPAGVEVVAGDLRQNGPWQDVLGDVDAVIHCAAAASGDLPTQLSGTVLATENLLAVLPASLARFVHISSFSVYDFAAPGWSGRFDEEVPLEPAPLSRDAYTQTKLQQERMVRAFCAATQVPLAVLRPGAIYGPGKDWDYGRALRIGRFDLIFAPFARMRLVHVDNCAAATIAALAVPLAGEAVINLVDDEQPGHWRYHHLARRAGAGGGLGVPVPYWLVRSFGAAARLASTLFFAGRARLPEMLDPPRQRVRWRSLRYANARAKRVLGWQPSVTLAQGLATMIGHPEPNGKNRT